MRITDAQVHVWHAHAPERPWTADGAQYAHRGEQPFPTDEILAEMDAVAVDSAFLVSPTWEGYRNDVVLQAATDHPDRFAVIAPLDLSRPDAERLRSWCADPRVVGVHAVFHRTTESWLRDGTSDWFWPRAEYLGLAVMVYAPRQYRSVREVAEQHPRLRLALCLGLDTKLRDDEISPHIDEMLALAHLPNVAVKTSFLPSFVTDEYPFASLHSLVQRVLDAFGPRHVFWGSDLSRLQCSYREIVDLFLTELSFLDEELTRWVMGQGLRERFGWPHRGSPARTADERPERS